MDNTTEITWADLIHLPLNYAKVTAVVRDRLGGETTVTGVIRFRNKTTYINIGGIFVVRQSEVVRLYHHKPVRQCK